MAHFCARHQFMVYEQYRLAIPSNAEYSVPQLRMMLREVEEIIGREIMWMLFSHARKLEDHKIPGKLLKNKRIMR